MLKHYKVDGADIARFVGYRYGNGTASAELFFIPFETDKGSCVSRKFEAIGEVTPEGIAWRTPSVPALIKQIVWLPTERQLADCSDMFDGTVITVKTPIEEATLQRLYANGLELVVNANDMLGERGLPVGDLLHGRMTEVSVSEFSAPQHGESGTYSMRWTISQCSGLSIAVESESGPNEFHVVGAWRVVC